MKRGLLLLLFSYLLSVPTVPAFADVNSGVWTYDGPHIVQILSEGEAAYARRIEMIRTAKTSLDLRYFIFSNDTAGNGILKEIEAAVLKNPKLKVRLLLDYWVMGGGPEIQKNILAHLARKGVQFAYYNPSYRINVSLSNRRDHGKVFIKDCQEVIVGGRNIAEDYFEMNSSLNFFDRDVWLNGNVGEGACQNFDAFWKSPLTEKKNPTVFPNYVPTLLSPAQLEIFESIMITGQHQLELLPSHLALNGISFLSDHPIANEYGRVFKYSLNHYMEQTQTSLYIESPAFMPTQSQLKIIENLASKAWIQILTNSPETMKVSPAVKDYVPEFVQSTFEEFLGIPLHLYLFQNVPSRSTERSLHAKTYVRDRKDVLISSFNFSPRSYDLSAETGIIIWNTPALAEEVLHSIDLRTKQARAHVSKKSDLSAIRKFIYKQIESQF